MGRLTVLVILIGMTDVVRGHPVHRSPQGVNRPVIDARFHDLQRDSPIGGNAIQHMIYGVVIVNKNCRSVLGHPGFIFMALCGVTLLSAVVTGPNQARTR